MRPTFYKAIFYIHFQLLLIAAVSAQLKINSHGLPPIRNFTNQDYQGHPQNWAFIQDDRGLIYAANTEGVLAYDGENWRHLTGTSVTLSFAKGKSETIYYGAVGDFGLLAPDSTGSVELVSLKYKLDANEPVGAVQAVRSVGEELYFVTFQTIFIYNEATKQLSKIQSADKMYPSFIFNDQLHVRLWGKGLFKYEDEALVMAQGGEYFADNDIGDVIVFANDSIMTVGGASGAHFYSADTTYRLPHFDHPFFRTNGFYKSIRISGGYIALCFLRGGLVIVDKNWKPVLHLDDEVGFENQTHHAFEDAEGNLWVGTNAGISLIELTSPVSSYSEQNGLNTAVYGVVEHKGEIFATGNAGVFRKPKVEGFDLLEKGAKSFKKINNSPNIGVELLSNERSLFSLHTTATGEIINDNFKNLFLNKTNMSSGTFIDPTTILSTSDLPNKLELFKEDAGRWNRQKSLSVPDLPEDILLRMEYDQRSNTIWSCTFSGRLISFKYDESGIENVMTFDSTHQVPADIINVFKLRDSVRIFSSSGLFRFSNSKQKFIKDERFADYFDQQGISYMTQENDTTFWYATRYGENGRLSFNLKTHEITTESVLFNPFNLKNSGNLHFGKNSGVLVPTMSGMLVVNPEVSDEYSFSFPPLVSHVDVLSAGDSTIFHGCYPNSNNTSSADQNNAMKLAVDQNALRFVYSIPYFKGGGQLRYQIKLDGFDQNWSAWTEKNEKEYTNIPGGSYQFLVRAQNTFGVESEVAAFSFTIAIPWYLTTWAYGAYFLLFILIIWAAVKINSRRLTRENEKLEETIFSRTQEIRYQAEKLRTLDNAKSRFFANISHELRTPLTLIQGPLESVLNGSLGKVNDKIKSNLDLSRTSTKKLLNLVEEILDLSKLEAGKMELKNEAVRFHDLVKRIFFTYQSSYSAKSIAFQFDYQLEEDAIFRVDIGKLEKVLDNLMSNAVKFTESNGVIKMEVVGRNDKITITISDTGIGISPDELDQIFNRFYQAGKGTKYTGGTGIGLSLAKELATLMHGELEVTSKLGEGTAFSLTIPMEPASKEDVVFSSLMDENQEIVSDETDTNLSDPLHLKAAKILIVEDDDAMRGYIKSQLGSYSLDEAADGLSAIEKLETNSYDLIITDLMMPKLDGLDLVAHLRTNESTKNISVIMLTARADDEDIVGALTIGVNDYMIKPFNPEELKARVVNVLSNRMVVVAEEEKPTSADEKLVEQLKGIVRENLKSGSFNTSSLANEVSISERQLSRKLQQITGLTAGNFIKEVRLNEARLLLENRTYTTISEVAYAVGFEKPGYFSEVYYKRFGKKPAEYLRS